MPPPLPTTPGLHEHVAMSDYLALPGVSQSALKHFRRSPAHVRHYLDSPSESTPEQALGTAAHCAILEPERFRSDYFALPPDLDRRTKLGKAVYEEVLCYNPGRMPIPFDEHRACEAMAASVRKSPYLRAMLDCPGANEAVLLWDEGAEYDGLRCKARLDRVASLDRETVVVLDPKTTRDASPGPFAGDCARFAYHLQAAFYLRGLDAACGRSAYPRRFVFVALEKTPPYCCAPYELSPDDLAEGRALVRDYLSRYRECVRDNRWPGYPPEPIVLQLPSWARRDREEEGEVNLDAA